MNDLGVHSTGVLDKYTSILAVLLTNISRQTSGTASVTNNCSSIRSDGMASYH